MSQRQAELWVAAIVCVAYVVCGQLVESAYPFSSFPMYARVTRSATRIVAVDAAGAASDAGAYTSWRCNAIRVDDCLPHGDASFGYRDREALRTVRSSAGEGRHPREPVLLVVRIYDFAPQIRRRDCVIAHCTAERR